MPVAIAALGGRHTAQVGVEVEILPDRELLVEAEALGHVADTVLNVLRRGHDIDPRDVQLAVVGHHQARDQAEERGLSGAVGTGQDGQRTGLGLERDAVQRLHRLARLAPKRLAYVADRQQLGLRRAHGGVACDGLPVGGGSTGAEVGSLPGSTTVTGIPSLSTSAGSSTNTRIS